MEGTQIYNSRNNASISSFDTQLTESSYQSEVEDPMPGMLLTITPESQSIADSSLSRQEFLSLTSKPGGGHQSVSRK